MKEETRFSAPGVYRIEFQGRLDSKWHNRMGSMKVLQPDGQNDGDTTVLQGVVSDQAELTGILNTLYELHMSLCAVNFINEDETK